MDDSQKSKAELVNELKALRLHISKVERKQTLSQEDRLKLEIIDNAPISIWACDRDFKLVFWSKGTSQIYDRTKEEVLGKNYLDILVSDEERERSALDCLRVIDENYIQRNFLAYDRLKVGTKRALLTNCFRVYSEEKREFLQAEVALEIPELEPIIEEHRTLRELGIERKAELERILLLERLGIITTLISSSIFGQEGSEKVFKGIIEIVKDIIGDNVFSSIYLFDAENHLWSDDLLVNENEIFFPIKRLLGDYTVLNKSILFIDNENDIPLDLPEIKEWWNGETGHSVAALPLLSLGNSIGIWLVAVNKPYSFTEGIRESLRLISNQVAFAVSISRLIQNLRELNVRIAEKQDLITRSLIAVDFVHRMNNLAGPIRGWTGLILDELDISKPRDRKIQDYLTEIDSEVKGLLQAANKLEQIPKPQEIDLNFMLNAMLRNVKIQYPKVIIETNLHPDLFLVRAIYSQISDAIWNVVSNAVDAMDGEGILVISSNNIKFNSNMLVEITINDTGKGIPNENQENVFDINYTTKGRGRGYGLWRTKNIIEDLGGKIELTETGLITGTTFKLLIPAIEKDGGKDSDYDRA